MEQPMKKIAALALVLLLLPACVLAEGRVINLVADPNAEWSFQEGAEILELWFPPVKGADACILRMGDEVMMVDAATEGQRARIAATLREMGVTRVDTGFNTHPHDDHIAGFKHVPDAAELGRLIITFPEDANNHMKNALRKMKELGIPVEHASDGDVLRLGQATLTVNQRSTKWMSENNRSAMLMVEYGECRMLLAADVELDGQNELLKTMPEWLKADILKYPHHGVAKAGWNFLKHVGAELAVITNGRYSIKNVRKDSEKRGLPLIYTDEGIVRLRTDGQIWVVDQWEMAIEE